MKYTEKVPAPVSGGLAPLVRILHGTAMNDMTRRGVGLADLQAAGRTWVLTQLHAELLRAPSAGEDLTAVTWPTAPRLGIYPRRYELLDRSGAAVARMHCFLAVMDRKTRTLASLGRCSVDIGETDAELLRPAREPRVPEGGGLSYFSPEPRQIDENDHLNNAAYVEEAEKQLGFAAHSADVFFEHEVLPGETVTLRRVDAADGVYFEGTTERVCFRAVLR